MAIQAAKAGSTYGRWTVIQRTASRKALARCECGVERVVEISNLTSGKSQSCGCLAAELWSARNGTHRQSHTRLHNTWIRMRQRCTNPTKIGYEYYGGRGIKVCSRWDSFENFRLDMGEPAPGLSLDRIDPNGDYEPGNCRWASKITQARNTRANHFVELDGQRKTLAEWGELLGINPITISKRLRRGWSARHAVYTPNGGKKE